MAVLRCPVCKADNTQGPGCRRCKADLSLLFQLEDARASLLGEAQRQAAAGRWRDCLATVQAAHALRADDDTRRLGLAAQLLAGDFAEAIKENNPHE